jgi:hypothetical protein
VLSHPLGEGRALRLLDDADAGELQALIEANRAHLSQWMPWAAGATLESTSALPATSAGEARPPRGDRAGDHWAGRADHRDDRLRPRRLDDRQHRDRVLAGSGATTT